MGPNNSMLRFLKIFPAHFQKSIFPEHPVSLDYILFTSGRNLHYEIHNLPISPKYKYLKNRTPKLGNFLPSLLWLMQFCHYSFCVTCFFPITATIRSSFAQIYPWSSSIHKYLVTWKLHWFSNHGLLLYYTLLFYYKNEVYM